MNSNDDRRKTILVLEKCLRESKSLILQEEILEVIWALLNENATRIGDIQESLIHDFNELLKANYDTYRYELLVAGIHIPENPLHVHGDILNRYYDLKRSYYKSFLNKK